MRNLRPILLYGGQIGIREEEIGLKKLRLAGILAAVLMVQGYLFSTPLLQEKDSSDIQKQKVAIRGTVSSSDGIRLVNAEIRIDGTNWVARTDENGSFSFEGLPREMLVLVVSCPGFQTKRVPMSRETAGSELIEVRLDLEQQEYDVTASPSMPRLMDVSRSIGLIGVAPSQIETLPFLGDRDLFRSFQLIPGISATNESSSGLFVRGGTPGQNLVLFDGFTLYEVDHFFGVFSSLNNKAIKSITLHKGGFGSRYGNRLSSVVDIQGNSGRSRVPAIGGGINFLSFDGYADVPLGSRGAIMFAGRKSFQSPFSDRILETYSDADSSKNPAGRGFGGFATDPETSFWDANARVNYELSPNQKIVFSFYMGDDKLDNSRDVTLVSQEFLAGDPNASSTEGRINNRIDWGNTGLSASWQENWSNNFFSTITLAYSRFFRDFDRNSIFFTEDESDPLDFPRFSLTGGSAEHNRLEDYTVRFHNYLGLSPQHVLEFGAEATRNQTRYNFAFRDEIALLDKSIRGWSYGVYVQDTWNPTPRLSLVPGARLNYFEETQKFYPDPRISASFNITNHFRLKAAGGKYHEFTRRLLREDPLQGDQSFWLLSDGDTIPVGSSIQATAGGSYETPGLLVDVEGFWKDLKGLSEFGAMRWRRGQPPEDIDLNDRFFTGTGKSRGVEILFQKKTGMNTGWVTYTLAETEYSFPDISSTPFPASHDSLHEFKLVDSHRWNNFTFSGNWVYGSGKPYTMPIGVDEIILPNEQIWEIVILGEKNSVRLPPYHRLDLSLTWHFWAGETSRANAGFSVFNVYDHKNVWRKEFDVVNGDLIETDVNYLGLTLSAFVNIDLNSGSPGDQEGPIAFVSAAGAGSSGKAKEKKEKVFDFLGTVKSMTSNELIVETKWGVRKLQIDDATITGAPSYEPGTPVHVYYLQRGENLIVTMVVRKIS